MSENMVAIFDVIDALTGNKTVIFQQKNASFYCPGCNAYDITADASMNQRCARCEFVERRADRTAA